MEKKYWDSGFRKVKKNINCLIFVLSKNKLFYSITTVVLFSPILEHEFFCSGFLGSPGSKGKKVDLSFSEQLLRVVFSTFCWQKYCSVHTKKLHKMKVRKLYFFFKENKYGIFYRLTNIFNCALLYYLEIPLHATYI